ncbi:cytochrome P450, partial [Trifolium medium]|nr:cytochrome P450 [Trifolium medium]
MCIRDEFCAFVLARYDQFTLSLLSALAWVHELNLGPVDFELDSKKVVDMFHARTQDAT